MINARISQYTVSVMAQREERVPCPFSFLFHRIYADEHILSVIEGATFNLRGISFEVAVRPRTCFKHV